MSEKEKNNSAIVRILAIIVLVGLIIMVAWILSNGKETRETTEVGQGDYNALTCTSSTVENAFFASSDAQRFSHEVKVLFYGESLKELSYRYDGTFSSNSVAENVEAWMHADYNMYMGKNGVYQESLNPVFSVNKSKLIVSLYAEAKKFNLAVAKLFFVDEENFAKLDSYKANDYKKMYEEKGFSCEIHD